MARVQARLNVRSGPGRGFPVVTVIAAGSLHEVLQTSDDGNWFEIDAAGTSGWISATFATVRFLSATELSEVRANNDTDGFFEDQDGDLVSDAYDRCPFDAGSGFNDGCPPDTDGDGVIDARDRCPSVAASTSDGCPNQARREYP